MKTILSYVMLVIFILGSNQLLAQTSANVEFLTGGTGWTMTGAFRSVNYGGALSGNYVYMGAGFGDQHDVISQSITGLTIGQEYRLTFYASVGCGSPCSGTDFNVSIDNTTMLDIVNTGFGWTRYDVNFVATATSQVVSFTGYNDPASSALSNVSITTYPPPYFSEITNTQQSLLDATIARRNTIDQNLVHIEQVGSDAIVDIQQTGNKNMVAGIGAVAMPIQGDGNSVVIRQGNLSNPFGRNLIEANVYGYYNYLILDQGQSSLDYGGHVQNISVSGDNNLMTTDQRNSGIYGHFLSSTILGNYNTQTISQSGNAIKRTFSAVTGNANTLSAYQDGLGEHYMSVVATGNGNTALVTQTGNTRNAATISLINAGAPASVTLDQSGGQTYSIERSCSTSCGAVIVSQ